MAAYNALQLQYEKTIIKKNNFVIRFLKFIIINRCILNKKNKKNATIKFGNNNFVWLIVFTQCEIKYVVLTRGRKKRCIKKRVLNTPK